jgi:hypothetical protein
MVRKKALMNVQNPTISPIIFKDFDMGNESEEKAWK